MKSSFRINSTLSVIKRSFGRTFVQHFYDDIVYPFFVFWNVTYMCHLAYSTKIIWCILICRIIPLQVHNINYDDIYYILENFWTTKSKNWVNKRYLNTINCLTMAKNAYLSYLRINVLIAIHFYSIYQLNSQSFYDNNCFRM